MTAHYNQTVEQFGVKICISTVCDGHYILDLNAAELFALKINQAVADMRRQIARDEYDARSSVRSQA